MIAFLFCEAEYMITTEAVKKVIWFKKLIKDLKLSFDLSNDITLCMNSASVMKLFKTLSIIHTLNILLFDIILFEKRSWVKRSVKFEYQ